MTVHTLPDFSMRTLMSPPCFNPGSTCHPGIRASEYPGPRSHMIALGLAPGSRLSVLAHSGRDDIVRSVAPVRDSSPSDKDCSTQMCRQPTILAEGRQGAEAWAASPTT